ncbi:MAG: ATPase [Pseudomonadota bacterium]
MIYETPDDWLGAKKKRVMLFAMSGLGKTHISNMLRDSGGWFHYSVDYRIGTRYMGEHITDNFKSEAMKVPFLAELLRSDSIYVASNITFNNLAPLSTYLGKPGDPSKGGLPFDEYLKRQEQHRLAEVSAMLDTQHFIERAERLYGYENFICDTSGSICEVVDPENPNDMVLKQLSQSMLLVWIEGSDAHTAELVRRFDRAPKPMFYQRNFLHQAWQDYREDTGEAAEDVDPDRFVRWTYARALAHRQPRYRAIADHWGITVPADRLHGVHDAESFEALIAETLAMR